VIASHCVDDDAVHGRHLAMTAEAVASTEGGSRCVLP
jgi:hypothetical protein